MDPLILCLAPVKQNMTHDKFLSYSFPNNSLEFIDLCDKFYSNQGLSTIEIHPFMNFLIHEKDVVDIFSNYKQILIKLREKCPDLLFNINYLDVNSLNKDISNKQLFPFPKSSIINVYINSYYRNGKRFNINHTEVIENIKKWQELGIIVIPVLCTYDDVEFLNNLIDKQIISQKSLVLFEFSGSGNLNPTSENYITIKKEISKSFNIIVACEGTYWERLARNAIVNGDHVRIGLKDSLAVKSNEDFYNKIYNIASAFGRTIANKFNIKEIIDLNI